MAQMGGRSRGLFCCERRVATTHNLAVGEDNWRHANTATRAAAEALAVELGLQDDRALRGAIRGTLRWKCRLWRRAAVAPLPQLQPPLAWHRPPQRDRIAQQPAPVPGLAPRQRFMVTLSI